MRKIVTLLFLCVIGYVSAQNKTTLSLATAFSEPNVLGLSIEHKFDDSKKSYLLNVGSASIKMGNSNFDITGNGFVIDLGSRRYYYAQDEGLYTENFITYGNLKFDESYLTINYNGTYSYWSIFNPNIGYKFYIGKISIDPSLGFNWKWEVKGKGIVDNKDFDNFVFKAGIKVGYTFN